MDMQKLAQLLDEAEAGDLLACADLATQAPALGREVIALEFELARRGQGVQVDDPRWLIDAGPSSVLLYTLKEVPGRRGKPEMTNDLMIRIQNGTGSNHDLRALAARIRAALASPGEVTPELTRLRNLIAGLDPDHWGLQARIVALKAEALREGGA